MNKKSVKIFILCFGFMLLGLVVHSKQKTPPQPNRPGKSNLTPPPGLPIDGGLSLLLITGVVYGIFELKRKK